MVGTGGRGQRESVDPAAHTNGAGVDWRGAAVVGASTMTESGTGMVSGGDGLGYS